MRRQVFAEVRGPIPTSKRIAYSVIDHQVSRFPTSNPRLDD
jgi:hypothetical protein